jgi:nucleoside-diphosphate-sugar epimerase
MAMLDALLERLGSGAFLRQVLPVASRSQTLLLRPDLPPLTVTPLREAIDQDGIAHLIHCAFLTRDRVGATGLERYVRGNREIIASLRTLLNRNPHCRLVSLSSGAAAVHDGRPWPDDGELENDPYGVLKQEEEAVALAHGTSLVLRPYAVGGRRIRSPERFALGSFLLAALKGEAIRIEARRPVLRSFVDSADLGRCVVAWLLGEGDAPHRPIAACTFTSDLLSLAERITRLYDLPAVEHAIDPEAEPQDYTADPDPFLELLARHGCVPGTPDRMILETAAGMATMDER